MYTFHFYNPLDYSHQLTSWTDYRNIDGGTYPDVNKIITPSDVTWADGSFSNPTLPLGDSEWTYYEGVKYRVTNHAIIVGKPVLASDNNGGSAQFDNFVIKEYDENGVFIRNIFDVNIDTTDGWYCWSQDGSGSLGLSTTSGYDDLKSLFISSASGYANASNS